MIPPQFQNIDTRLAKLARTAAISVSIAILIAFFSRPAHADLLDQFSTLAFPITPNAMFDQQTLDSANSLGVVKLSSPLKVCDFGISDDAVREVESVLRDAVDEYPDVVHRYIDLDCSAFKSLDVEKADVAVWVTQQPKHDVVKYLENGQRVGWPNYLAIVDEFELSRDISLPSVNITNYGKSIRGLVLLKQEARYSDKVNSIVGYLFGLLNPKSVISQSNPTSIGSMTSGKLKLTELAIRYLTALYLDSVKYGDSEKEFLEDASRCIAENRC